MLFCVDNVKTFFCRAAPRHAGLTPQHRADGASRYSYTTSLVRARAARLAHTQPTHILLRFPTKQYPRTVTIEL